MDKKLKLGFVGLGRGLSLISSVIDYPFAEIRAVCDLDAERRNAAIAYLEKNGQNGTLVFSSYDRLLNSDVDAVVIATEAAAHTRMALQALSAGKHALSEIPAINSLEEAKAVKKAVKENPCLKYMAGENCCFWAFINTWKAMVEHGLIGDIWYAESEYLHNVTELMRDRDGRPTWRSSYDAIKYLTHNLGPLLYLSGDACVTASGFAPEINPIPEFSTGTPNEIAIFKTKKGALIKIFVSFGLVRVPTHNFCVYGSRGTLETDRIHNLETKHSFAYLKDIPNAKGMIEIPCDLSYPGDGSGGHGGADGRMMRAFVDCVLEDKKPPIDADLAIKMSLPGIYAHLSATQNGVPIAIPEV